MGLHDGLSSDGTDSNASVAKLLGLKVLLVVDCRGMHRTIAALVNGLLQFDQNVAFGGVILNRLRSPRHAGKIRQAIDEYCDMATLGEIPETDCVCIEEKQLGLTPAPEHDEAQRCVDTIADLVTEHCDVDTLLDGIDTNTPSSHLPPASPPRYKVGIARDAAFHFYYQDDLDYFSACGVELIVVSPLRDELPADLDGLLIGGGFPERYAAELMKNESFRASLHRAIDNGLVVHAECAGLMYLCEQLNVAGQSFEMVGSLLANVTMQEKPVGRGYALLRRPGEEQTVPAHEFHHSSIEFQSPVEYVFEVERGHGIDGKCDGVCVNNAYAGYSHFRHTRRSPWIDDFLRKIEESDIPKHRLFKTRLSR